MSSSSIYSSQELKYPPIRVSQSLERLDLNALIMRSNPRRLPEETNSSLDESTYEVLGDSIFETSDDEGNTESLASTDRTPDDVSNFSDEEEFDHEYVNDVSQHLEPPPYTEAANEPLDAHPIINGEESTVTEVPHVQGSENSRVIKLEEEATEEQGVVKACGLTKSFEQDNELPDVLRPYGCPEIRLTVRAALSQRFMPVSESFRILYIGDIEVWVEKDISSQIGAALDASPGSSRSIMVRGQMEPYGPVLDIDHCSTLKTIEEAGKLNHVLITLDDGTQLTLSPKQAPHGTAPLPDLVIFCYPSSPPSSTEAEKFRLAREIFQRHQIPSIDIALTRPWGNGTSTSDSTSLQFCVEGRQNQNSEFELKEVLPIDHYTFIHLDPVQLNRHLAHICPRAFMFDSRYASSSLHRRGVCSLVPKSVRVASKNLSPSRKLLLMFIALTTMVGFYVLSVSSIPVLPYGVLNTSTPASASPPTSVSPSITMVSQTQTVVSLRPKSTVKLTSRDLTIVPSENLPLQRQQEQPKPEKLGGFEIQTTSDHQFVLSLSQHFVNAKRKPQLQIQVSRDSKTVPIRYVRTASGVYIVDLEQEYPLGAFNVSIATHSKPLLQQSFEIKLGYNRSSFSQIMNIVKQDLALVQSRLMNMSSTFAQGVESGFSRMEHDIFAWEEHIISSNQKVAQNLQDAKEEAERQFTAGTRFIKEIPRATWMAIRTGTAPARTSAPMLRARKNALRMRCKIEIVAGLSTDDKQSWACGKVQMKKQSL